MKLAIIQHWNESYGYNDVEMDSEIINSNENNLINYMKKKKFVIYNWDRNEDYIEQTIIDFISLFDYLNNIHLNVPVGTPLIIGKIFSILLSLL